jgi:hypothetical protein
VVGGNLVATLVKFVLFRTWIFRDQVTPRIHTSAETQHFPTNGDAVATTAPALTNQPVQERTR